MTYIKIKNLKKTYYDDPVTESIRDISLDIEEGEFVTFFGPNGGGKTTMFNVLCGLETDFEGRVTINKKNPEHARVGFVFQNYHDSMFPWRTVIDNVTFGLEMEGVSKAKREQVGNKLLQKVNLWEHHNKFLYQLSGGMKQLTSICRALAFNPDVLLMDEPFSALDYHTSRKMEMELLKIWRENKKTTLFISHEIDEAVLLADRVVVLSKRPAEIKGIVKVDLPRPRTLEMLRDERFYKIRNKVLDLFEDDGGAR